MARARTSPMGLHVATQSFAAEHDGSRITVHKGDIIREGHPLVRGREDFFKPLEDGGIRFDHAQKPTKAPAAPKQPDAKPAGAAKPKGRGKQAEPATSEATAEPDSAETPAQPADDDAADDAAENGSEKPAEDAGA